MVTVDKVREMGGGDSQGQMWGRVGGVQGVGNHGAREGKRRGIDGVLGAWNNGGGAAGARITRHPLNALRRG